MSADILVTSAQHARDWFDLVTAGSAVFGLIVVTAYTTLTYKQWNEARVANNQAKKHHELGARAWLLATNISRGPLAAGINIVSAIIEHVGTVPATNVTVTWGTGINPTRPEKWEWHKGDARGALGGTMKLEPTIEVVLSEAMQQQIVRGEVALWMLCRIDYSDYFAVRNPTIACWKYAPRSERWLVMTHDVDQMDAPHPADDEGA